MKNISNMFKNTMSSIASNAMILTSATAHPTNPAKMFGTTLSSVASVTVHPEPIVQFNIQIPSATSSSMHELKYMALHVLKPNLDSVELARSFSRGARHESPFQRIPSIKWEMLSNKDFDIPILHDVSDHILICEKYKVFEVYNHEIWTCKIVDILTTEKPSGGLLYYKRKFHTVGKEFIESK